MLKVVKNSLYLKLGDIYECSLLLFLNICQISGILSFYLYMLCHLKNFPTKSCFTFNMFIINSLKRQIWKIYKILVIFHNFLQKKMVPILMYEMSRENYFLPNFQRLISPNNLMDPYFFLLFFVPLSIYNHIFSLIESCEHP